MVNRRRELSATAFTVVPTMTGLFLHTSTDATALTSALASGLGGTRADPFMTEVVVTPHAHVRRWLTNELAQRLGRPGEGICAGVSFLSPGRLLHELGDEGGFWRPRQLSWRLLRVIGEQPEQPQLEQLRRHLAASRNAYPVAHRIATLFQRYLQWRPGLVARWEAGENCDEQGVDLGFDTWQPVLWRLAAAEASPLTAADGFIAGLRAHPDSLPLPSSVSFVHPDPFSPWWLNVLHALAEHRDVHVFLPQVAEHVVGSAIPSGPVGRLTGHQRAAHRRLFEVAEVHQVPAVPRPITTLGWLQRRLVGQRVAAPTPDHTVQVHGGHGLERQVEILRDAITALLAADPTLEPRHLVVGCPNPGRAAPLIQAAFRLPVGVPGRHPAHDFRVQLADRSSAEVNPLVGVLIQTLTLLTSRATSADVIELCVQPAVAARFGLDSDAIARLTRLADDAGVRWGLSAHHRDRFGLGQVPQNTWTAGLQRMLLGVALSEELLPMVGTVLPLDGVEDGDLLPLGGLSELISRLSHLSVQYQTPTNLAGWVTRLQWALDAFTEVSGDNAWQRTDALLRVADLAERGAGDEQLELADITSLVTDEFERGEARSTYGNGSLTVCSLASLRGVPYRVVCLFGLDDGVFPRAPERDGDNLMLRVPQPGEPDPPAEDRQALIAAINAAGESVVIVHQSRSAQTNEPIPPPAALADLLQLLDEGGVRQRQHPLQPFSPSLFGNAAGGVASSYDPTGLRGALAVSSPRHDPPTDNSVPPAPLLTEVSLDDLIRFVRDPARHFLRERCGLTYWDESKPSLDIPIELDHLQRWGVGDRLLGLVRAGHSVDDAIRAEWLRGAVPPGAIGTRMLNEVEAQLTPIANNLPQLSAQATVHHDISVDCGPVRFTGRVATQQDLVLEATFSKVSRRRTIGLWLQLLALAATDDRPWQGLLVGRGGRFALRGPDQASAHELLGRWIRLYRIGLDAPLPLPLDFGAQLADLLRTGRDPMAAVRELRQAYDSPGRHWTRFFARVDDLLAVPMGDDDLDQPSETLLACAAARLIWHPISAHEAVPVR